MNTILPVRITHAQGKVIEKAGKVLSMTPLGLMKHALIEWLTKHGYEWPSDAEV